MKGEYVCVCLTGCINYTPVYLFLHSQFAVDQKRHFDYVVKITSARPGPDLGLRPKGCPIQTLFFLLKILTLKHALVVGKRSNFTPSLTRIPFSRCFRQHHHSFYCRFANTKQAIKSFGSEVSLGRSPTKDPRFSPREIWICYR